MKVFDGWVMKGEKFPSSQDHPLPLFERYVDYCDSGSLRGSVRSSQNVAMVFFRIHNPGSSFTLTIRKHINPFREYDTNLKYSLLCSQNNCTAGESVVITQPRRMPLPSLILHQDQSGNCCVTLKNEQSIHVKFVCSHCFIHLHRFSLWLFILTKYLTGCERPVLNSLSNVPCSL